MDKKKKERNIKNADLRDNEDLPVIDYITTINRDQKITMLEVGSGECRFVKKIKKLYPNIEITCIEINPQLASLANSLGFSVINDNILNISPSKKYDIVHCSHVIEHFGYPEITNVLDFLVASVNPDGRIIIRSPLIDDKDTWNFYGNIDHIKPYPPEAIINYFDLSQQQRQGRASIQVEKIWYRTSPKQFEKISTWHFAYCVVPLRRILNYCITKFNGYNNTLWCKYRWPSTKPNGYVIIIEVKASQENV